MDKDSIKKLCRQYEDKELKVGHFIDALEKEGVPCQIGFIISDLHRKVNYLTNISKLDEKDQQIAAKWEAEREERDVLYKQLSDAEDSGDKELAKQAIKKLCHTPMECEHGRHIVKTCLACEHIERTLYPDMFEAEEDDE